jgi:simple sugar transport system substrate-binding protein
MDAGVDVFTSIAGGAARGVIRTAIDRGAYVVSYNNNEYQIAPGLIVGCGIMEQKKLVTEVLGKVLAGEIKYGISETVGIKEGYIGFILDDPAYEKYLPEEIRGKFESFLDDLKAGRIDYKVPPL